MAAKKIQARVATVEDSHGRVLFEHQQECRPRFRACATRASANGDALARDCCVQARLSHKSVAAPSAKSPRRQRPF
jgi:hypothetical protein